MVEDSKHSLNREVLPLLRIESGGQTGADRAALDVARKFNFPYGGWCPKGRKTEDGPIHRDYMLVESPSGNYLQRTEWNARGSKEPELHGWVCKVLEEALFQGEPECYIGEALSYLGPEIDLTGVIDNGDAPLGYGEEPLPNYWRFYYNLKNASANIVGGDQPYLLIEKGTGRIQETGIERGE